MSIQPQLHVQNIFDALNPNGTGVTGNLKQRCLHLQKRVIALAKPGDIVAVSADCSQAFIEYMTRTAGVSDIVLLRYQVSTDPQKKLNSQSIFKALLCDAHWEAARQRNPVLNPYMKSAEIYRASKAAGIASSERENQAAKDVELSEKLNNKAIFYRECKQMGAPVPSFWVFDGKALADQVLKLLLTGHGPLNLRQAQSGGTVGNITIYRIDSRYCVPELKIGMISDKELVQILQEFVRSCFSEQFVVAELLDLYASPGTLFYLDKKRVNIISHTKQILNKNRYFLGFSSRIEDKKIREHFPLVEKWIHHLMGKYWERGYRGYGNIDWMVTKSGEMYLAELNARQTGVIPPFAIANACLGFDSAEPYIVEPNCYIVTRDALNVGETITFEQAYVKLERRKLLWGQSDRDEGVIISIPPSPECNIPHMGIVAISNSLTRVYDIIDQTLHTFGLAEIDLLFVTER